MGSVVLTPLLVVDRVSPFFEILKTGVDSCCLVELGQPLSVLIAFNLVKVFIRYLLLLQCTHSEMAVQVVALAPSRPAPPSALASRGPVARAGVAALSLQLREVVESHLRVRYIVLLLLLLFIAVY